jgi:hypothetical protein
LRRESPRHTLGIKPIAGNTRLSTSSGTFTP